MASIFSKNAILAGRLDYYCLICDTNFKIEDAALTHILDIKHKEALKTCGYWEKYKEHLIRKTKGIYFCEPCSLTFPTATKVELHIDEDSHLDARNKINLFNREKNEVKFCNRFIISDDAWNGCIEDTCVLCNTEFDDAASHRVIRSHVLNLIKSEVIFDDCNGTVYRTIDDKSKQCLTCNEIIGNDLESHSAGKHEFIRASPQDYCEATLHDPTIQTKTSQTSETPDETQNVKVTNGKPNKKGDINVVNGDTNKKADKNANNVNKGSDKDVKKEVSTPSSTKPLDKDVKKEVSNTSDSKPLEKEKGKKQNPKQSVKKETAKELDKIYCKNLGAKNYITGEMGTNWCILCEWLLEETPENHIRSKHHQNLLKLHNERLEERSSCSSSKDEESIPHESVERYQKSNINIDLTNETAFCKKCSKNIDLNTTAINKHIEEHEKTSKKKSPETLSSGETSTGTAGTTLYTRPVLLGKEKRSQKTVSVGDYAKQHGFTHNVADCSYYCRPCSRRLNANLDDLQKHVASKIHNENTKQISKIDVNKAPVKEPLFDYIKLFELVDTMTEGSFIVINDKFWLNAFGFFLIARKNDRIFCHGCHIDLTEHNVVQHIAGTDHHRQIIEKCLLITSLENEFIREIKLDLYHCGYCNIAENDLDDIVDHIATAEHKRERAKAEESLSQHQPNVFCRTNLREIDDMIRQFVRRNP